MKLLSYGMSVMPMIVRRTSGDRLRFVQPVLAAATLRLARLLGQSVGLGQDPASEWLGGFQKCMDEEE